MEKQYSKDDWSGLLYFIPQLLVIVLITFNLGAVFVETRSAIIAYPQAFLIGVVVAYVGTVLCGDSPSTIVEFRNGGIVTLVLVLILTLAFLRARQNAQTRRAREAKTAKAKTAKASPELVAARPSPSPRPPAVIAGSGTGHAHRV